MKQQELEEENERLKQEIARLKSANKALEERFVFPCVANALMHGYTLNNFNNQQIATIERLAIRALQAAVHANAVSKGWYENPPTFAELLMLVVSEASEALEDYRNGLPVTENHYKDGGKPCGIPSELADIVIRVLDM